MGEHLRKTDVHANRKTATKVFTSYFLSFQISICKPEGRISHWSKNLSKLWKLKLETRKIFVISGRISSTLIMRSCVNDSSFHFEGYFCRLNSNLANVPKTLERYRKPTNWSRGQMVKIATCGHNWIKVIQSTLFAMFLILYLCPEFYFLSTF